MRHAQADIACVDKFAGTINMEEYFNRYTPCREQAAEALAFSARMGYNGTKGVW